MRNLGAEIVLSVWDPGWMEGTAVQDVCELMRLEHDWRTVSELLIPSEASRDAVDLPKQLIRVVPREIADAMGGEHLQIASEFVRNEQATRGVQRSYFVEYALSIVPCALGLHATDVRLVIPNADIYGWAPEEVIQRLVTEATKISHSIVSTFDPLWMLFSLSQRGPSVAELYQNRAQMDVARVHVSKRVTRSELGSGFAELVSETPLGWEASFSPHFGGRGPEVSVNDGVMRGLRKVTLPLIPWPTLSSLTDR